MTLTSELHELLICPSTKVLSIVFPSSSYYFIHFCMCHCDIVSFNIIEIDESDQNVQGQLIQLFYELIFLYEKVMKKSNLLENK